MAILQSVNIGQTRPIPTKSAKTGIFKEPVDQDVQVEVTKQGLTGDAIINRKHHGGVDQAVYLYFADDYAYWEQALGREITPGTFGENLTIGGVEGRSVCVGDRFEIEDVVLEVTSHRTPCNVFAVRMGSPGWVKQFFKAGRPGAYCRVIKTGQLRAGEPVIHVPFAGERISVSQLLALEGQRDIDPELIRRLLKTPIHYKMRADFEERVALLF
ncbi:MOSC domain-containing protein YiiM [Devosia subaequoris]|uniref:MOSC domain-containing protein YiiM n=1 Tax=Devosia subaequoris TaxID=395930 RepID=A0A7W6IQJ3_9HYPH|nr:MOSC domain-containing protein [Devosia subaequoris]MBB4053452.1 MOSC domain-containing protein YiiM [Devosia subaequoris]MCP1210828.1 MOSC domain-containing protein [Devosia subaequoris]